MSWLFSGVFVMAALLGSANAPYSATHPAVYAGTYAVRMCHGPCVGSSATPFRSGTMVLFSRPLQNQHARTFRSDLDRNPSNACFVFKRTNAAANQDSYIPAQGFFSWALRDHIVAMLLVRSPDGGYGVNLHLTPDGLGGTGSIWGGAVGPAPADSSHGVRDSVSAVRIGEPDITQCPPLADANG